MPHASSLREMGHKANKPDQAINTELSKEGTVIEPRVMQLSL